MEDDIWRRRSLMPISILCRCASCSWIWSEHLEHCMTTNDFTLSIYCMTASRMTSSLSWLRGEAIE